MRRMLLIVLVSAGIALPGCGKKDRSEGPHGGAATMGPAAPAPRAAPKWLDDFRFGATDEVRYKALEGFVRGWPKDREALPEVLAVLRKDESIRGGVALSLARLGAPLVPALVAMVQRAPKDHATLLAAGALSYHLVTPQGLAKRTEGERAALRRSLAPVREALWKAFLADLRPDLEIYQGLATGGVETAARFRPPFPEGGLSRVAMVLYLMLTRSKGEVLLPEAERRAVREAVRPLAPLLAKALVTSRPGPTGESPDSLVLGLSVLGSAGAAALVGEPGLRPVARCEIVVRTLVAIDDQAGPRAAAPARAALARCLGKVADATLAAKAKALLPRLTLKP